MADDLLLAEAEEEIRLWGPTSPLSGLLTRLVKRVRKSERGLQERTDFVMRLIDESACDAHKAKIAQQSFEDYRQQEGRRGHWDRPPRSRRRRPPGPGQGPAVHRARDEAGRAARRRRRATRWRHRGRPGRTGGPADGGEACGSMT